MNIELNDILELDIDDLGANGEGIAHYGDKTVFVPFGLPSEHVKAKVVHVKRNLVFTELKQVVIASPNRVEPICPIFGQCGGCSLMHLDYESQLKYKQQNVVNILRKNAAYTGAVAAAEPSQNIMYYRNKIQLPFGTVNGSVVLGFFAENSHRIIPLKKCFLHADWADKLIALTISFAERYGLSAYNEQAGKGILRHLIARYIGDTLTVTLVINGSNVKNIEKYAALLASEFSAFSLYLSPNTARNNVIMGKEVIPVAVAPHIINVMGINIEVNPLSFFQINDYIRDKIYAAVVAEIRPNQHSIVIDAYSGVGLLGAIIAKAGAQVYNIEIVKEAIKDADKLYKANGIFSLVTNICGDAATELPKLLKSLKYTNTNLPQAFCANNSTSASLAVAPDGTQINLNAPPIISNEDTQTSITIVIDPPRKGISEEVINAILGLSLPHKLIYISCNPATLSRDLALLSASYTITKPVVPYDMFPLTPHIEALVVLVRN